MNNILGPAQNFYRDQVRPRLPTDVQRLLDGEVSLRSVLERTQVVVFFALKVIATIPFVWYNADLLGIGAAVGFLNDERMNDVIERVRDVWTYNVRGVLAGLFIQQFLGIKATLFCATLLVGGAWGAWLSTTTQERKRAAQEAAAAAAPAA